MRFKLQCDCVSGMAQDDPCYLQSGISRPYSSDSESEPLCMAVQISNKIMGRSKNQSGLLSDSSFSSCLFSNTLLGIRYHRFDLAVKKSHTYML